MPVKSVPVKSVPASNFRNAIVFVFDGLSPGFLGPYGNTWVETPAFNELAAESVLVEQAIADCPTSGRFDLQSYFGLWDGQHVLAPRAAQPGRLISQCRDRQINTHLITDDETLAHRCAEIGFDEIQSLPPIDETGPAAELSGTRFAQLIGAAMGVVERAEEPFLIWIHASSLITLWDAPESFLDGLLDSEDPRPPARTTPPNFVLDVEEDPDVSWGWSVLYAAQVRAIDACLGIMLASLRALPGWQSTLLALTATHGYPLGEHQRVGSLDAAPHTELVHVPLLVRFPDSQHAAVRLQTVCQPATLHATLAETMGLEIGPCPAASLPLFLRGEVPDDRAVAVSQSGGQQSIRTPAWHAVTAADADQLELYVKPDDRWDFNEVSQRCPEICRLLLAELDRFTAAAQAGRLTELTPLPADLIAWRE